MSIIKKIINESNEAVKLDYTWGTPGPDTKAVEVRVSSDEVSFQLSKLPRSITLASADDYDYSDGVISKRGAILDRLNRIKNSHPTEFDKLRDEFGEAFYKRHTRKKMSDEVSEELGELFDHLTTILKARLITFAHELKIAEDKELDVNVKMFNDKLDAIK